MCLQPLYGSCPLFESYTPQIHKINIPQLRSTAEQFIQNLGEVEEREDMNVIFSEGSVAALAAPEIPYPDEKVAPLIGPAKRNK